MRWMSGCFLALILVGCGGPSAEHLTATAETQTLQTEQTATATCLAEAKVYADAVEPIATEWDDAMKLAGQTGRGQLAPQIASLQEIKRKADDLSVPTCAAVAHDYLVDSMNANIDGFLAFMSQKPDDEVSEHFKDADTAMSAFKFELQKAVAGK